ncbi:MAG: DUF4974 domain-containing protein [Bacteroidales bacterium]|nr:DUF4974 domain-containing protein [Bacteroidales bacterium]
MDRLTLLDYINGRTNAAENEAVRKWAEESRENRAYLESLMDIVAIGGSKKASEEEYQSFLKSIKKKKYSGWRTFAYIAAATTFVLSLAGNIFSFASKETVPQQEKHFVTYLENQLPADSLIQEIYVSRGARSSVTLPDGSKVWLNSDSKLRFPVAFASDKRSVELSGEAYFDVVKNEDCPMYISLKDNYLIEVLGTQFNVRAYDDEEEAQTTLYSGVIKLYKDNSEKNEASKVLNMQPNEVCVVKEESFKVLKPTEERLARISAWKDGSIYFDNTPLGEVLKNIERHHGVNIHVSDQSILNYSITARFDDESAIQIMDMIRYVAPVDYRVEGKEFTLFRR